MQWHVNFRPVHREASSAHENMSFWQNNKFSFSSLLTLRWLRAVIRISYPSNTGSDASRGNLSNHLSSLHSNQPNEWKLRSKVKWRNEHAWSSQASGEHSVVQTNLAIAGLQRSIVFMSLGGNWNLVTIEWLLEWPKYIRFVCTCFFLNNGLTSHCTMQQHWWGK